MKRKFIIIDRGHVIHHTSERKEAIRILELWNHTTACIVKGKIVKYSTLLPSLGDESRTTEPEPEPATIIGDTDHPDGTYRVAVQDSRTGKIVALGKQVSLDRSRHLEVVVLAPGHRLNPIPEVAP